MSDRAEVLEQIREMAKEYPFTVEMIESVNYKPHPYMIGPQHIPEGGGVLDDNTIRFMERLGVHCGWRGCTLPYDQHTYDTVMFIKLKQNVDQETIRLQFLKIKPILEENKIDGIGFLETPEKYRILGVSDVKETDPDA